MPIMTRPQKSRTGQAPSRKKMTPVASQPKPSVLIRIWKPVRPSDRCGVRSARKNGSSAAIVSLMEVIIEEECKSGTAN
jgi:hypothetical protein